MEQNNLKRKKWGKFFLRAGITCGVYMLFLWPTQLLLPLLPGTEVRVAAFVPLVFGIVWGWPAALGVAVGNLVLDFVFYSPTVGSLITGSLLNGLTAMCARKCYFAFPRARQGEYVYHFRSLLRFFFTAVACEVMLASGVALTLYVYSGVRPVSAFPLLFLNNIESCLLFGLPLLMFSPRFMHPDYPTKERQGAGSYALFGAMVLPVVGMLTVQEVAKEAVLWGLFAVLGLLALFAVFGPSAVPKEDRKRFFSLRSMSLRFCLLVAVFLSLLFSVMIYVAFSKLVEETLTLWWRSYALSALMMVALFSCFTLVVLAIHRKLTDPLYHMTRGLRTEEQSSLNEMEVLSNRLDFVANSTEVLKGNEFTLYIGLTTRDGEKSFTPREARARVDEICLRYVSGCISSVDGTGGYKGEDYVGSEGVLIYTIFGATDEQIHSILQDTGRELNQESILVDKNHLARWYYYTERE